MIWYALVAFFHVLVVLFSVITRSKWVGVIVTLLALQFTGFFSLNG